MYVRWFACQCFSVYVHIMLIYVCKVDLTTKKFKWTVTQCMFAGGILYAKYYVSAPISVIVCTYVLSSLWSHMLMHGCTYICLFVLDRGCNLSRKHLLVSRAIGKLNIIHFHKIDCFLSRLSMNVVQGTLIVGDVVVGPACCLVVGSSTSQKTHDSEGHVTVHALITGTFLHCFYRAQLCPLWQPVRDGPQRFAQ